MDDLTLLIVSIVASIYLPFIIYLISKLFAIKEYREKQNKAMFDWVTSTLFDRVYEPLNEFAGEIQNIIYPHDEDWEEVNEYYRRDILLFSTARFLHYAFKNREKVGGDEFFTQHDRSNEYLKKLFENICTELKQIFAKHVAGEGNLDECAVIRLQFLATLGKAKNYSEFKMWITGRAAPHYLQELTDREKVSVAILKDEIEILEKITLLKSAYSGKGYLSKGDIENYSEFVNSLGKIFDKYDPEQRLRRAELYAYCNLFQKLLRFEMHRMYDSWYIGYKDRISINELFYVIDKVFDISESKEEAVMKFSEAKSKEEYEKLLIGYNELCSEEQSEIATTKAIMDGSREADQKTLDEINKQRDSALERIRDDKKKIENYGFITSADEIEALYSISQDNNKLFEEIKSNRDFKGIISKLTHR